MNKVIILTEYNIRSVPLELIWGKDTFEDGISLTPSEFYERLKVSKTLPSTSQPSVGKFQQTMNNLLGQGYDILGIFLSSKLSGTFQAASQARALLPERSKVEIIDSQMTTLAMGFQVLMAARAANQGEGLSECAKITEQVRLNSGVYFMVDTLEFLHRGGRSGGAQRFLGTTLGTKPILYMHEGKIESLDRVRTKSKALDRLGELVTEQCAGKTNIRLASVHANASREAETLLKIASQKLSPVETLTADLSPVIGIHAGPGTLALAYMTGL